MSQLWGLICVYLLLRGERVRPPASGGPAISLSTKLPPTIVEVLDISVRLLRSCGHVEKRRARQTSLR